MKLSPLPLNLSRIMYYPEKTGFHCRKSSKIRDNFFIMASGGNHNESTDN